jgi:hypothetical protein
MTEQTGRRDSGKGAKRGAPETRKRLAAALRRNLAKRKDTKETKSVDKTERD